MAREHTEASELVTSLFISLGPSLFRYVVRATGSPELADDTIQEVFLALYRKLRLGERVDNPAAYVFGAARNQVRKEFRKQAQRNELLVDRAILDQTRAADESTHDTAAGVDDVMALFSVLTEREESVVLLRLQSLKYREIADQLDISPKTVATLLARSVRKLRKAVKARPPLGKADLINAAKHAEETLQ